MDRKKTKLSVRYNPYDISKKKIKNLAKDEVKQIYEELREKKILNEDLLNIFLHLDTKKDKEFILLFFYSLFCSYYHAHKANIDKTTLKFPINKCYKHNSFVILDHDHIHEKILKEISIYFNTDANNLMSITGEILFDLNNIDVKFN